MTAADLVPIIQALLGQSGLIFAIFLVSLISCVVNLVRLVIVIYRSVKGRMNRV